MFKEYYGLTKEEQLKYDTFIQILYGFIRPIITSAMPIPIDGVVKDVFEQRMKYWENKFGEFIKKVGESNTGKKKMKYMVKSWKKNHNNQWRIP